MGTGIKLQLCRGQLLGMRVPRLEYLAPFSTEHTAGQGLPFPCSHGSCSVRGSRWDSAHILLLFPSTPQSTQRSPDR